MQQEVDLGADQATLPIDRITDEPDGALSLGSTQLPNATRAYRNGTHQGIDFGCGTSDRFGYAIADGTVVYLIDDYRDPTVPEREALRKQGRLELLAGDPDYLVRQYVAKRIPAGRLFRLIRDPDPQVRQLARVALGEDMGHSH